MQPMVLEAATEDQVKVEGYLSQKLRILLSHAW